MGRAVAPSPASMLTKRKDRNMATVCMRSIVILLIYVVSLVRVQMQG